MAHRPLQPDPRFQRVHQTGGPRKEPNPWVVRGVLGAITIVIFTAGGAAFNWYRPYAGDPRLRDREAMLNDTTEKMEDRATTGALGGMAIGMIVVVGEAARLLLRRRRQAV